MNGSLFSKIIKDRRKAIGWTISELSRVSGIHPVIIHKVENDKKISIKHCWTITKALDIPFKKEIFTKLVKIKRTELGLTEKKLSHLARVSYTVIYWLEKEKTPSVKSCYKIAKALKITPNEITICFQ
jgi:transcriptional regulator with XRE-family HTH domain